MDNFNITGLGKSPQLAGLKTDALLNDALNAQDSVLAGEAKEAAAKFEALLATTLVKEMRKTLPEGFFGSGAGSDVFDGWLDEHVGKALAQSGGLDLAGMIKTGIGTKQAAEAGLEGEG